MALHDFGLFAGAAVTDAAHLRQIMVSTRSHNSFVAGYEGSSEGIDRVALGVDCDLIYPKIFVGDSGAAQNLAYLQRLGVTHVLNAAEGNGPGMVPTTALTYAGTGISYLGLPVIDVPEFDIALHFEEAVGFIANCGENGKVLVLCLRGRSRSATLTLAYLMKTCRIPGPMAMKLCCSKRSFHINDGFLQQLAVLHNSLCVEANGN